MKYPHFEIWSEALNPMEIAYVILYTAYKDEKFTDIEAVENPGNGDMIEDEESSGTFTWVFQVPDTSRKGSLALNIEYSWSGGWHGGSSGGYMEPPEDPTTYMSNLDIEDFFTYDDDSGEEISIKKQLVDEQDLGFTYQDMIDMAMCIGANCVGAEEVDSYTKKNIQRASTISFPTKLQEKIDKMFSGKTIKTRLLSKRYGLR